MAIEAPRDDSSLAIAAPIPEDEPEMTATLPARVCSTMVTLVLGELDIEENETQWQEAVERNNSPLVINLSSIVRPEIRIPGVGKWGVAGPECFGGVVLPSLFTGTSMLYSFLQGNITLIHRTLLLHLLNRYCGRK